MRVPRLREELLQVEPLEGAHANAHRRTTVLVPLRRLQQTVLEKRRALAAQTDAHRREEVRLHRLREEVHEERPFGEAREETRQRQVVDRRRLRGADFPRAGRFRASEAEPASGDSAETNAADAANHTAAAGGLRNAGTVM